MSRLIPYLFSLALHLLIFLVLIMTIKPNRYKTVKTSVKPVLVDIIEADTRKYIAARKDEVKKLREASTHSQLSSAPVLAKVKAKNSQPKGKQTRANKAVKEIGNRRVIRIAKIVRKKIVTNRKHKGQTGKAKKIGTIKVAAIDHNSIFKHPGNNLSGRKRSRDTTPKGIREGKGSFKREAVVSIATKNYKYASYMAHIKRQVESVWIYPEEAIEKGESGVLFLFFIIDRNGSLKEVKLLNSSGYKILDDAAIEALKDAAPFPPFPKRFDMYRLKVYASFRYDISFDTVIN